MISNPPSEKELKELGRKHLKEHCPKQFRGLQEEGNLEEALDNAARNTLQAYQNAKSRLLENGLKENEAHDIAWELVREEWLLIPSEK